MARQIGPQNATIVKNKARRRFLTLMLSAGGTALSAGFVFKYWHDIVHLLSRSQSIGKKSEVFISKASGYDQKIGSRIAVGLRELGVTADEIRGKTVLLKPNLVETSIGTGHINTHPSVVCGAVEAFRAMGAASVVVAEGPGHCRDSLLVLEQSGMAQALHEKHVQFVDLNYDDWYCVPNTAGLSKLKTLTLPATLRQVDFIVSMAKMKTHHWTGVTLSMKNLFGVMPGMFYGWPKNALHVAGIQPCILDINAVVRPHLAIVDGIVGMAGDGPIMGKPCHAGVLVLGRNLTAVDATCARIMGISPRKVSYLAAASLCLGPIDRSNIQQLGESISSVRTKFELLDYIPAQRRLLG